ncbi:hypothetical protein PHYPSEUDO_007024 [Phytophthora pseudosyringae]|uniref:Uncharacterized protein n=1 Tax=Phytophthora pseudosyringae TaxID=221518 RepID=A0A8T1VMF4_9STRA|nr:hypothetical protein PHYPSEUDO_007024 [Phytophthora pseudosyringae]
MVNIREALRALDIWQSRDPSSADQVAPSESASDPQSKAAILESKNRQLKGVISSLQDANLRLSRQLDSAKLALSPKSGEESTAQAWSPRNRAAKKLSSVEVSPVQLKATSPAKTITYSSPSSQNSATSSLKLQVVNFHEQELVEIASKLQFTGVKRLEELLVEGDADSTGFVNLKKLCWTLADQFELKTTETRLIEVCIGMKFNSHAQLDYNEFVDVLMDILLYALPDIRESAKRKSLIRLDQYLQSGFPPGREGTRQLLETFCSKYDVAGDQLVTEAELVRVFHVDLVQHHALELPFPLEEHETIQLAHPFIQRGARDRASEGLVAYCELLNAILGPLPADPNERKSGAKQLKRALRWEFWHSIYMALCAGDARMERKVLAQLGKIMEKVDPDATFTVSMRHFKRIFKRHLCYGDMEVLVAALAMSEDAQTASDNDRSGLSLRYDVLLSLVFGSPGLNDDRFFDSSVREKLSREEDRLRSHVTELMAAHGSSHRLSIQDFHNTFTVQAEGNPLTTLEMLFMFASVDSSHEGSVAVKALKNFLSTRCRKDVTRRDGENSTTTAEGGATNSQRGSRVHPSRVQSGRSSELAPPESGSQTISSLRVFEIKILDIASEFADRKGNISPARAFRYFSIGPTAPRADTTRTSRRTPPSSPLRRSSLSSPTNRGAGGSVTVRKKLRELEACSLDPLTPDRVQKLLQVSHNLQVSTHLVSQFFLHIGSPSKYFLDLLHFAQWAAPLSVELQVKVRGVVRQMIILGKGGGGRVDLDRFLAQLQRRLQDSPHNLASTDNPPLQFVSMPLLLSKLHQLNILLHKQELMALLRHFGMDETLHSVDYALFLQRLYERNSSSVPS